MTPPYRELLVIVERESLYDIRTHGSIIRENAAKNILYHVLGKQCFIIDADKSMPNLFIENAFSRERVRPDFLLLHVGNTLIPNVIPVEIDWSPNEISRHLPKMSRVVPVFIDIFPHMIFDREIISIKYVTELSRRARPQYNILISPAIIKGLDDSSYVEIKIPIYSIRYHLKRNVHIELTRDLVFSLIYAIHYGFIEKSVSEKVVLIIYSIMARIGYVDIMMKRCSKGKRVKIHPITIINDRSGFLREKLLNADYYDLCKIFKELLSKYINW